MKLIRTFILGVAGLIAFAGCGSSDDDADAGNNGKLLLEVDTESIVASEYEQVNFTVSMDGKDITSLCKIWNMSSAEVLPGKTFSTTTAGDYRFTAKYNNLVSNEVVVKANSLQYFTKNLLFQQITSTSCNNCPAFTNNILMLTKSFPEGRIKWLAFHGPMTYTDPFQIQAYTEPLLNKWGSFYPNGVFDQVEAWGNDSKTQDQAKRLFNDYLKLPGKAGIAITSTVNGKEITIQVKVKSLMDFPSGCRISVALSENYLSARQANGSTTIEDYAHDHVVRKFLTEVFGTTLEDDEIRYQKDWEKTYTYSVTDKDVWNLKNMDVTVAVIEGGKGQVVNCQSVKLGESVDFEYAEVNK